MKFLKTRDYNINVAFKVIILLGFSLFFFLALKSGRAIKYVHPRNLPFIGFASFTMLIMAFFLLPEVFKPQRIKVSVTPLVFFLLPLIMAFLLPTQSFDSRLLSYGDFKVDSSSEIKNTPELETDYTEDININENSDEDYENTIDMDINELELIDGIIMIDSSNFVRWIQEIYENIEKYEKKKIEVTGFVFKDKQFEQNEFVAARMMMVCCAADMQPVGLLCRYDNATELKKDLWVKVHGIIEKSEFKGSIIPVIKVIKVEKIEKPKDDYVYPF